MARKDGRVTEALKQQTQAVLTLKGQFSRIIEDEGEDFTAALIEGETNFIEIVSAIAAHVLSLEGQADGIKNLVSKLQDGARRRKETAGKLRQALALAMEQAGEKRAGPVSLTPVLPKAVVTNEQEVPDEYWKTPDPVLDKTKLNKDINEPGRVIPGVVKGNGSNSIRIMT